MFSRIRNRLALLYTILTALALGSFALIFYFGLSTLLMNEQERDLKLFSARISHDAAELLKNNDRKRSEGGREKKARGFLDSSYAFFVVTSRGDIVGADGQDPALRPPLEFMSAMPPENGMLINTTDMGDGGRLRFLWTSLQLREDERSRGLLIVGKDLSAYDHFLSRLAQTLWGSLAGFLLLAGAVGHFAAGRALVPIRRSFEAQRQFVADASHELRTPLSVIQASLDVVEKEERERMSSLSRQILDDLKDEVRRMARLTTNLLTLARADAGGLELNREHFDAAEAAEHVFRTMQPLAEARGVILELSGERNLFIQADKDRIVQLLMILADNGIKFTPSGGRVTIRVDQERPNSILLEVADTGMGLSPEDRQRVFERFYRVDKARSREEGGAGLGLSIAVWIVDAHGGTIEVQAAGGGGSLFRVVLPTNS